ncbi:MAG: hypothetical protein ABSC19_07480 [Syntrophorhabdales bacterium]|jgi:hypothetical protein
MFGLKKRGQVKSVEEFIKGQDAGSAPPDSAATGGETNALKARRWLLAPVIVAAALLVLLFAAFVKIANLESAVAQLRQQNENGAIEGLRTQVAGLLTRLDKADAETGQIRTDIARLEKDIGAVRVMSQRKPKKEVPPKKQAATKKAPPKAPKRRT